MKKQIRRIPITREGYDSLVKQLADLKAMRPDAVNTLSDARRMGDLSENGLYTAAKMRLKSIDAQIFRTDIQIKLADIQEGGGDNVRIGSTVTVDDGKRERTLYIVGHYEADPLNNKISSKSPIGRSLMYKQEGESVTIHIPTGKVVYKILKIL